MIRVRRGDIFTVDLEPTVGREQRNRRPVLVVSPDNYNDKFAPLVCPITTGGTNVRDRGFAVELSGGKTIGVVLCNQMRTLDLDARQAKRVESIDAAKLRDVLFVLQDIVADN
ncbi:MAG: type II toxin-antitoxin system PemK/MazF family toxin [Hyphomicrobiaceae bacterium]|nr:type II toxin-antitoxin system PemK/MazF family toxin [Hyphomicrobiaceae bacterium]